MQIKDYIDKLKNKGRPLLKVGGSGSGKSTFGIVAAKDTVTMEILKKRQGKGKGTLVSTHEIITDYDGIPDGHVLVSGILRNADDRDKDDNELLGIALYHTTKELIKNPSIDFIGVLKNKFKDTLNKDSNETLAFRIKDIENIENAVECFGIDDGEFKCNDFIQSLITIYADANNDEETIKYNQDKTSIFTKYFKKKYDASHNCIVKFWEFILSSLNNKIDKVRIAINSINDNSYFDRETNVFYLDIDDANKDTEIVNTILNSERSSIEHYISDMTIYYKGKPELFNNIPKEYYTAIKENGKEYSVIHFIDTMGLFHKTSQIRIEKQRIFSLLTTFHSLNIIIFIDSNLGVIDKNSIESIKDFLRECVKTVNVYVVFTKYDVLLHNELNRTELNPFLLHLDDIRNYPRAVENAESVVKSIEESFNSVVSNTSNVNLSFYKVGYPTTKDIQIVLLRNKNDYWSQLLKLLTDVANHFNGKSCETLIRTIDENSIEFTANYQKLYDYSEIFKDISKCIMLCEGTLSIHWSTIEALKTHWGEEGESNVSYAGGSATGYARIEALFVNYIKNIFNNNTMIDSVSFKVDIFNLLRGENKQKAEEELKWYIKTYLKKEFVKMLYKDVFNLYKDKHPQPLYYTEELDAILHITKDNYFYYTNIPFHDNLIKCYKESLVKCVNSFIKERCVEVY